MPAWSGQRQRASLKGFARLKAILWRRSLWLYQEWKLASCLWYRPLTRALSRATGGFDLFSASRVRGDADVFGETPILTTVRLLEIARAVLDNEIPQPFVDLGCGRGVTCLASASTGVVSLGFEQEADWVQAAGLVARELSLPATFQAGDFLRAEWPEFATYLVVATAYPADMRLRIAERLAAMTPGTVVITADWALPENDFERLWEGPLPVEWGVARFAVWRLRSPLLGGELLIG